MDKNEKQGYLLSLNDINNMKNYKVENITSSFINIWNTEVKKRIMISKKFEYMFGDGKIHNFKFKEQKGEGNTLRELWYVMIDKIDHPHELFEIYGDCFYEFNIEFLFGKEFFEL